MTTTAKLFVTVLLVLGACVLATAFSAWTLVEPFRFAAYFLLAVTASVVKVTIPALAGRMPFNFVFVLIGIIELSLPETLLLGCSSVLIECIWRPQTRTSLLELLFSVSNLVVAVSCAYYVFGSALLVGLPRSALILLATTAFFVASTFPLAAVIALTERRPVLRVWRSELSESFPFYVVGAVVAWAFDLAARYAGWQSALLILPVAYLLYRTYRLYVARVEDEKVHAEQMANLHLRTIEALALAIEAKDNTTHDHLKRVQVYAMEVGRELGLSADELEALQAAAVLHDIGKLAVPEHIISKPGKLTPEEFEKMKIHPVVGAEILEHVQFPYPVVPIVRSHHEKWNGTGYPFGLRGKDIPIGARILSVVDALDALASDRQYRRALPLHEAMAKVEAESGRSFDPQVVEVLKRRHVELEKKAQQAQVGSIKLSTDLKIQRGAAPAAGFAAGSGQLDYKPGSHEPPRDFLHSIAVLRQDLAEVFDGALLEPSELEERFAVFSVRLKKLVPFEAIAVYFVHDDEMVPAYVSGDNYRLFSSLRIPVGQGLSGWVAENRKPILNGNPSVEPGYLNNPSIFSTLRSALSVPLIGGNGVIGAISLYHELRDAYSQEHMRLLQALAPRLALSIERSVRTAASDEPPPDTQTIMSNNAEILRQVDTEVQRAKRLSSPIGIMVCTIDRWPDVARQVGRSEAARVLRAISVAVRESCREYDIVGRIGESEFVIIVPGVSAPALAARAAKLMQISIGAGAAAASLIAGEAVYPDDGDEAEALLSAADRRLFEARYRRQSTLPAGNGSSATNWVQ